MIGCRVWSLIGIRIIGKGIIPDVMHVQPTDSYFLRLFYVIRHTCLLERINCGAKKSIGTRNQRIPIALLSRSSLRGIVIVTKKLGELETCEKSFRSYWFHSSHWRNSNYSSQYTVPGLPELSIYRFQLPPSSIYWFLRKTVAELESLTDSFD